MNECDCLLLADYIVTQNERREIIEKGAVAVDNGKIADIGAAEKVVPNWKGRKSVDAGQALIMPGLINAHTHAAMTFLRGLADDLPLLDWRRNTVFPIEARLVPEIVELGSLLGYAEMLATGTTACADMYIFEDSVFKAAKRAGIRCLGGEAIFSFPSAACSGPEEALELTGELAERYADDPLIDVAVNPHSVYTVEPKILRACSDLAKRLDAPLHIHLAETASETVLCLEKSGQRPIALAEENGVFDGLALAAHLVDINEEEADFLASKNVVPVHNPGSNMKLASGVAPAPMMLERGLPVALGTDGPASNNTLNMFAEMNRTALLHKATSGDAEVAPASVVLDMATRNGARIFRAPGLGSLEKGAPADLIILDITAPHMRPFYNPVSQIVYAASGHECRLTMIDGKIRYDKGKYSFDYDELLRETEALKKFVRGKYS